MKLAARCLQLDVGNSGAKWRLLEHGGVTARGTYRRDDPTSRDALLNCTQQLQQVWVSSVAEAAAQAELTRLLFERWGVAPWYASSRARTGDLHNSYARPERMGVDRWLAMLAARQRARERACVVDAGSALTIDLISASGQHEALLRGMELWFVPIYNVDGNDEIADFSLGYTQIDVGYDIAFLFSESARKYYIEEV